MLGESFQAYSGSKLVHVPYKGSGPAMQDVMGGQVDILFDQFPSSKTYIDAGKLKPIGAMSPHKIPGYPNIMTMEEGGLKGFTDEAWYGLLAPAGVPAEVSNRLGDAMKKVMASPDLRKKLEDIGARPVGSSPAEFKEQVKTEIERMKKLVKDRNVKLSD
jgi:tripartite-type tricarboxylate transporter receptor subunit TctC